MLFRLCLGLLDFLQFGSIFEIFIEIVERVTTGAQAVARRGGAVAKSAADETRFQFSFRCGVGKHGWIRKHRTTEANRIDVSVAHVKFRDVREIFLQVGISGADGD